jgi:hypothetical protein
VTATSTVSVAPASEPVQRDSRSKAAMSGCAAREIASDVIR